MTEQQRRYVDTLLRQAPSNSHPSVAEQRAGFAVTQTTPVPGDVHVRSGTLGGRPALFLAGEELSRATAGSAPRTLLYLHGGGYVVGSAETGTRLALALARRAGAHAISLDYRLAPEHPFPAAVNDGLAAYRELLASGADPRTVVLAGDSAGGGLAIATLVAARAEGLPLPAAVVVFSPWVDLTLAGSSLQTKHGIDPLFTREHLASYVEHYVGAGGRGAQRDPLVSPIFADLHGLPPLFIQVGANEVLLDDALRLAARAGADDVAVTLQIWPDVPHVFQNFLGELDDAVEALDQAAAFVRDALPVSE